MTIKTLTQKLLLLKQSHVLQNMCNKAKVTHLAFTDSEVGCTIILPKDELLNILTSPKNQVILHTATVNYFLSGNIYLINCK